MALRLPRPRLTGSGAVFSIDGQAPRFLLHRDIRIGREQTPLYRLVYLNVIFLLER